MWMQDCPVDLDYHLRRVRVPAPGGRRELDQVIGEIASTPLDRTRPLWEFHFAEGMAEDRFALIGKVHHTLADGVASANLLARLMDLAGSAQDERDEPPTACAEPSTGQLLWEAQLDHFQNMAALPGLFADAARGFTRLRKRAKQRGDDPDLAKPFNAPPTFLNHVVSPVRTFATATLSLAEVKETAKKLGVTFNDVVLAVAAGGLRELLLRYDGRADRPDHGDGSRGHRQVRRADHRQRDRRHDGVAAGARRRSARPGRADLRGDADGPRRPTNCSGRRCRAGCWSTCRRRWRRRCFAPSPSAPITTG